MMQFTRILWRFYCNLVLGVIKINSLFQEDDFLNCQFIFDQCFPLLISTDDSNNSHQRKMYSKWPKSKSVSKLLWLILLWLYSPLLWIHARHLSILYGVALLGLYSVSGKTSYRKISRSLEAARFEFKLLLSFWNLTDTLAAALINSYLHCLVAQNTLTWFYFSMYCDCVLLLNRPYLEHASTIQNATL